MWLGEQISERGIGNGMSLIIFVGIVVGLPRAIDDLCHQGENRRLGAFHRACADLAYRRDDRRRGVHRLRGGRAAAHSRAIRQARHRSQSHGRAIFLPAFAREFRRRDSADFREFAAGLSGNRRVGLQASRWAF